MKLQYIKPETAVIKVYADGDIMENLIGASYDNLKKADIDGGNLTFDVTNDDSEAGSDLDLCSKGHTAWDTFDD